MRQVRHLHEGVSASIQRGHQVVAPFPRPHVNGGVKKYFTPPTHPARAGLVRGAEVTEGRIFLSGGETDDRIEILSPLRGSLIERPGPELDRESTSLRTIHGTFGRFSINMIVSACSAPLR
jgi:hypothetical protein